MLQRGLRLPSKKFFLYFYLTLILFIYISFLSPVFSTGDGGELASTGYTLGIPHAPGYPVYTEISKLFTYLPIGNIGEKIALISVFFSVLSLFVLYKIIEKLGIDTKAFYFGASLLAISYTFWGESLIVKFYTFNLFFVALLIYITVSFLRETEDFRKYVYLSSFLLGIVSAVHHIGLLIVIPMVIAGLIKYRAFLIDVLRSVPFFITGFLSYIHLPIRSLSESSFLFTPVTEANYFWAYFLRKVYDVSSVEATTKVLSGIDSYVNTLNNLSTLFLKNFGVITVFLFLYGLYSIFKKDRKVFYFFLIAFFVYTFLLGKMAFDVKNPTVMDWSIMGHQYFLPGLFLYILFVIIGLVDIFDKFKKYNMNFLYTFIPPVLGIFPFIYITDRLFDSNYSSEYVPYSHTKVILGTLPVGSIYISFGDNHTFGGWYLKSISGFRNDICQLKQDKVNRISFTLQGCRPKKLYSELFKTFFEEGDLMFYSQNNRLYSILPVFKNSPYEKFYKDEMYSYVRKYIPVSAVKYKNEILFNNEKFVYSGFMDCVSHRVDEPFTKALCRFNSEYYALLAKLREPIFSENEITFDFKRLYGNFLYENKITIKIGSENFIYIWRIKANEGFNNTEDYFYLKDE